MDENVTWFNQKLMETAAKALTKHGFDVVIVDTKEQARDKILEMISPEATVGIPGTATIREIGVANALEARGNIVYHHWQEFATKEEEFQIRRQENNSDFLVSSSNAVTLDGALINIDGSGNRVAGQIFGPRHSIVVAGVNKLAKDVAEGLVRAKNDAAPTNAHRLESKTPCAVTGLCNDCDSPGRICRVTTIIERRPSRTQFTIILVGEALGY